MADVRQAAGTHPVVRQGGGAASPQRQRLLLARSITSSARPFMTAFTM
ncbi:hypothetical protein LMIY3S_05463 [Labrys miyagiensis]